MNEITNSHPIVWQRPKFHFSEYDKKPGIGTPVDMNFVPIKGYVPIP